MSADLRAKVEALHAYTPDGNGGMRAGNVYVRKSAVLALLAGEVPQEPTTALTPKWTSCPTCDGTGSVYRTLPTPPQIPEEPR